MLTSWDWFVLLVMVLSTLAGIWRGFVRTVFALAAWLIAFFGAAVLAQAAIASLDSSIPGWGVYVIAFVIVFVAVRLIGGSIARGLRRIGLGGVDRLLGAAIGIARALLVVAVAVVVAIALGLRAEPAWHQALSRPLLDGIAARVMPLLPAEITGLKRA